ncbi:hypothetical protein [Bradyrhizobium sp. JR3.5]
MAAKVVAGRAAKAISGGTMSILSEFLRNYTPQNGWGTFFTAAFGAFAGAVAASRAHNKRTVVAELNALNAAHELAVATANVILALKRQHIVPLNEDFERIRTSYANHKAMRKAGTQLSPFQFIADMRSLTLPATPHVALERMIFEKTLARGRALAALVTLVGSIDGLAISINARNEMIEDRRTAKWNDQERLEFFLGLKTANGVIDERFPSNIAGITLQTDFCIFYAKVLANDLADYANKLRWKHSWFYRLRVPKIDKTDWSYPEKLGLMPKDDDYGDWLRGFQPRLTRGQRVWAWFRSSKQTK